MALSLVVKAIKAKIAEHAKDIKKLNAALAALGGSARKVGRPAGRRGRRKLSAAARRKISAAQKRRWAAVRKSKSGA
jgi:hypothetical protein